ncbi:quaternary amine ABC transporter ATP-binding protein [Pseudogemmobacter faecipullorum]|uniref:Quaternary amine transport ATP-binding protein n=1 Tax=Pseudogemmobacter faecipullorum TaxID=2755041 RepID=A0ABS8CSH8_9RHOB|nr:glycine betaine/L-proline ABC transporter ATP-binding protein [Pseudogemmobacter faecipullorum]MCB5412356.1 glycine betaine/L-proline ABC transporter ATP-binding protein [Pseudogemmobacter faecipullorum]
MSEIKDKTAMLPPDEEETTPGISIRKLYKIFGPDAAQHVTAVEAGMTKAELNRKYHHSLGLRDINTELPAGQISVIMGLSGSGKSTLLRHVNGLIMPTAGEVLIDGQDVAQMSEAELREFRRHKTAMVFQKFALLPHRTVIENTVYGLDVQGVPRKESRDRAQHWIERVGLKGYEGRYPSQLSGGMQQRVGLARALTNDAPVLLMDEAFSALDPLIRMDMQSVLLDIQKEVGKTIVFITHDLDEALRLGDKIVILRAGEVSQQGTGEEIVLNPENDYVQAFVREVNRGRVIRLRSILRSRSPGSDWPAMELSGSTTLESAALQLLAVPDQAATVLSRNGTPRGVVNMDDIMQGMLRRNPGT